MRLNRDAVVAAVSGTVMTFSTLLVTSIDVGPGADAPASEGIVVMEPDVLEEGAVGAWAFVGGRLKLERLDETTSPAVFGTREYWLEVGVSRRSAE